MSSPASVRALALCLWCWGAAGGAGCKTRNNRGRRGPAVVAPGPGPAPARLTVAPDDAGNDFVEQQMAMRVVQFATNMTAVAAMARGTLPEGATASHVFELAAGHCYRIIAVGGAEVNDLDMTLFAPDGSEVDSDTRGDNYPVIGRGRPVCPPNGGRYRLDVVMYSGQGEYGVQVFGTP